MTNPEFHARCLCGAIEYRINSKPLSVYACHCIDCQRLTSSAFSLSMLVPFASIELLEGAPASYFAALSGGRAKQGALCDACGSRLWGRSQRRSDIAVVPVAILLEAPRLPPAAHLWVSSALPWMIFSPSARLYDTQPEDPAALLEAWTDAQSESMSAPALAPE